MNEPRFDLETRCDTCKAYRYGDVNNEGVWSGEVWKCAMCAGVDGLTKRTNKLLDLHADGILINKDAYAQLLKEWVYRA